MSVNIFNGMHFRIPPIVHFQVAVDLITKTRLCAKLFMQKLVG